MFAYRRSWRLPPESSIGLGYQKGHEETRTRVTKWLGDIPIEGAARCVPRRFFMRHRLITVRKRLNTSSDYNARLTAMVTDFHCEKTPV
jgi:hypothetical protein